MTEPRRRTPLRSRRARVGLVALLGAVATLATACSSTTTVQGTVVTRTATASPSGSSSPSGAPAAGGSGASSAAPSTPAKPAGKPVEVSSQLGDGETVGVGMPIMIYLSRPIKDAKAFAAATKVTVNGNPVKGGWYFEYKSGLPGKPIEADYRLQNYWPGHARIHLDLPVKGMSAGTGLYFKDSLTLDIATGPANIVTVDDVTHKLTVQSDGKPWGTFPVSLGAAKTPTRRGIKVIMEQKRSTCMTDTKSTYYECGVKWDQRLTYDGEYLHAAPWNTYNIAHGINSSNGCTNLTTEDAKKLFDFLHIGDVVTYPNAGGPLMQLGEGYGDWNVPWAQWQAGGLYATS